MQMQMQMQMQMHGIKNTRDIQHESFELLVDACILCAVMFQRWSESCANSVNFFLLNTNDPLTLIDNYPERRLNKPTPRLSEVLKVRSAIAVCRLASCTVCCGCTVRTDTFSLLTNGLLLLTTFVIDRAVFVQYDYLI